MLGGSVIIELDRTAVIIFPFFWRPSVSVIAAIIEYSYYRVECTVFVHFYRQLTATVLGFG